MSIRSTISDFYTSIQNASDMLKSYQKDIDEKQQQIYNLLDSIVSSEVKRAPEENKLTALANRQIEQYNKTLFSWKKAVERYVTGKEFVNKFEKSLLLIVFADVKAGKSSLGNFISGYAFKDTPYGDLYSKPDYFSFDYTDKSFECGKEEKLKEGYFIEDEIQATASIQYFTLFDGLTWVDTPGIHSLTTEYEELAKQYVKYADLILFLTPSNNPMKQDEAVEIRKLIKCDKPLLIAITKSDSSTMTVKDGKVVKVLAPKDPKNRTLQEKHLENEVTVITKEEGGGLSQNRYISISTKIAKEAMMENDEDLFEKSNFPDFFRQIGTIISERSVELKMKRPHDELNLVIDELVLGSDVCGFSGIDELIQDISDAIVAVVSQKKRFLMLRSEIISVSKTEALNRIYSMLSERKFSSDIDNNTVSDEVSSLISEVLNQKISEIIAYEIDDFNYAQTAHADKISLSCSFRKKTKDIEYEVSEVRNRTRDPKGMIEHLQHLFGKEFTELTVKTRTKTKTIEVGDNFSEYAESVWNDSQHALEKTVDVEIQSVIEQYCGSLEETFLKMKNDLIFLKKSIESLRY